MVNEADPDWSFTQILKEDREGPDHLWQLSHSAIRRWRTPTARLGGDSYRPATLDKVKDELDALGPWDFEPPSDLIATEKVRVGDTLSAYAKKHYGDAELWREIYEANLDTISDADEIFPGQVVRIPSRTSTS